MNTSLKFLEFKELTEEWLDFIIHCRNGIPHTYDIVIGAMTNDQIYNYIADYIDGIITREQFWSLAKFKYPTHQINFCTSEALKYLTFVSGREVTKLTTITAVSIMKRLKIFSTRSWMEKLNKLLTLTHA